MSNLQDGINAFKNGNKQEARNFLIAAVTENPTDENAWGWLYQASESQAERQQCLKKILEINPNNAKARELLNASNTSAPVPQSPLTSSNTPGRPAAPKAKNNNTLLIVGGLLVILFFCCIVLLASSSSTTDKKARYVVNGSTFSASITYTNEQGGTEQVDTQLPFEREYTVSAGSYLSIVAQSNGTGSITCEIWLDGEKIKTSTSTAQYGVVTCSEFVQ